MMQTRFGEKELDQFSDAVAQIRSKPHAFLWVMDMADCIRRGFLQPRQIPNRRMTDAEISEDKKKAVIAMPCKGAKYPMPKPGKKGK